MNINGFSRKVVAATSVALFAMASATAAIAQDSDATDEDDSARDSVFGEIVVTATKREQDLQDVGIAITALGGEQLEALGYTNAQQVTALAPGVSTIQPNGESNYSLAIRGAANSDFTTNVESPVALYVDEVYISQSSGSGFALFDMERVEILRGPQGTLFGRNATGGLAHFITVKPQFDFGGYATVSYGSFSTLEAEWALNVPLSDSVATRTSVAITQGDGYVTNRLRPDEKLNNSNDIAGRIQLLWESESGFDALVNVRYGRENIRTGFFEYVSAPEPTGAGQPSTPNPALDGYVDLDGDVFAGAYDFEGFNRLENYGATLTVNVDITDSIKVTSITDYQTVDRNYIEDSDASPTNYFNFFLTTDAKQFSQELRLSGDSGSVQWVGGLYYMSIDINDSNGTISPGFIDDYGTLLGAGELAMLGVANGIDAPYTQDTKSYSVFGQIDWEISEQFAVTLGARYIVDNKNFQYDNQLVLFADGATDGRSPNTFIDNNVTPFRHDRSDNMWSARAQINYKPSPDVLTYISYNRGVRGGGYNAPLLPTASLATVDFLTYDPEELNAFEAGLKWDLPDNIGKFNLSAYYYDYNNFQAFSIIGLDTFTLNSNSKNYGFEAELFLNPSDGLDIGFGVGYIRARIDDVAGITDPIEVPDGMGGTSTTPAILPAGQSAIPVQTPEWNVNGLVRYEMPVGDAGAIALQSDFQYRSAHFFNLSQVESSREDGYAVVNASIAWIPDNDIYEIRMSVDNLFDAEYLVQTFDLSGTLLPAGAGFFGMIEQYYGRPRTWKISATLRF